MFMAVINTVEEALARVLQPLKDRRQVVEKEAADLTNELESDIKRLENSISKLTKISTYEDHILFLQVREINVSGIPGTNLRKKCFTSVAEKQVCIFRLLVSAQNDRFLLGYGQRYFFIFLAELPVSSRPG